MSWFRTIAQEAAAVTPSDTGHLEQPASGIYVGTTGNVALVPIGQTVAVTFVGVPAGVTIPVATNRVMSTNTTASDLVAVW